MTMPFITALLRFRLLPLTILVMIALFGVKLYDIREGVISLEFTPQTATAESKKEEDPTEDKDDKKEKPSDAETTPEERPKDKGTPPEFSQIEVDLLQNLSKRRQELETWEKEIRLKDNMLKAAEVRLEKKIKEMQALEQRVQGLLKEYGQHEDTQIQSLVKMYENMKPKDAARIFDEMEMDILLLLVDRMSERKAAPILASMIPLKAKQLTVELAEKRQALGNARDAATAK